MLVLLALQFWVSGVCNLQEEKFHWTTARVFQIMKWKAISIIFYFASLVKLVTLPWGKTFEISGMFYKGKLVTYRWLTQLCEYFWLLTCLTFAIWHTIVQIWTSHQTLQEEFNKTLFIKIMSFWGQSQTCWGCYWILQVGNYLYQFSDVRISVNANRKVERSGDIDDVT